MVGFGIMDHTNDTLLPNGVVSNQNTWGCPSVDDHDGNRYIAAHHLWRNPVGY